MFQIHESGSVSDSLVLTEFKNNNFTIIGGTKINRAREKIYIQIPQSRIDELLFQEATTKISVPNSKYNCSFAQKSEARFSSFYMENQKAVNLFEFKRNV